MGFLCRNNLESWEIYLTILIILFFQTLNTKRMNYLYDIPIRFT